MDSRKVLLTATVTMAVGLVPGSASAAWRMVGIVPSDGVAMLAKEFTVEAGTTVTGTQFENNDPLPEVVLIRGPVSALSEGTVVASATQVRETDPGLVKVFWSLPLHMLEDGIYYVGICSPSGPGKAGLGVGPAVGGIDVSTPNGSFVTCGAERSLLPARIDLAISLLTGESASGGGLFKAGDLSREDPAPPPGEESAVPRTFLAVSGPGSSSAAAAIEFGVVRPGEVDLAIYDVAGRLVRQLARAAVPAGVHHQEWDGRDRVGARVATGVYFVALQAGDTRLTKRLVVAR